VNNPFKSRPGKILLYLIKLSLSVYILYRISAKIDFIGALSGIANLPIATIVLLLLLTVMRHAIQYHNWLFALKINPGFRAQKSEVLASYMIGLPLRFALPGGHASFAKVFYVSNSSKIASLWSTLLERCIMSWANWLFAAAAALFYFTDYAPWIWIALFMFILMLPEFVKFALSFKPQWRPLRESFCKNAPFMMLLQMANTLITYLQYWLILMCFVPISGWETWVRMALVQFSNTIPITIAGLGLREGFAIHFLKTAGFNAEQAVSATLSLFIIHDVLPALVGTGFLLKTSKSSSNN